MILIKKLFHSSQSKGPVLRTKACWELRQNLEHQLINYTCVDLHINIAASQTIDTIMGGKVSFFSLI